VARGAGAPGFRASARAPERDDLDDAGAAVDASEGGDDAFALPIAFADGEQIVQVYGQAWTKPKIRTMDLSALRLQHVPGYGEEFGLIIHDEDCFHARGLLPKAGPYWGRGRSPDAPAGGDVAAGLARQSTATVTRFAAGVGRQGRHGRIAGRREPESRPEIGGRELLNFDELGYGHREGHGKHEEAESRHPVRSTVSRLKIR